MKIKSLLIGMLACTALVGCSNEEDLLNGEQGVAGKAEKAYLAVDLNYAGIDSRATEGEEEAETPTFAAGSAAENDVYDITFFFFDASDNAYAVEGTNNYLVKSYEKKFKTLFFLLKKPKLCPLVRLLQP